MQMLHFLAYLKAPGAREPGGTAGVAVATGELSNSETAQLVVQKALWKMTSSIASLHLPASSLRTRSLHVRLSFC